MSASSPLSSASPKRWLDMTPEQRVAASTLGYDKDSWDRMNETGDDNALSEIDNCRYSKYLDMLEAGVSEEQVRRKMDIAGFTQKEIRSLLSGDSVGPNAVPAPGVFSNLKTGSPLKQLRNIPTVLKNSLSSAIADQELHHYASSSPSKHGRGKQTVVPATKAATFEEKIERASSFKEKRDIMDTEIKRSAKKKAHLQRKLRRTINQKVGATSPSTSSPRKFSPKRDFDRRVAEAEKNDVKLGVVERELAHERERLNEKMGTLLDIRKDIEDLDAKTESSHKKTVRLLRKLKQMLVLVKRKHDGGRFTQDAHEALEREIVDPLDSYYVRNKNVHEYILAKLDAMEEIFPAWPDAMGTEDDPEDDAAANPFHFEKTSNPLALTESRRVLEQTGFSNWSESELAAVLRSTPGHVESGTGKKGDVEAVVGVYRQHVVAEPPQKATKYTRTVQIETPDGEFFMLGVYHQVTGIRQEDEIRKFNNKIVRVHGIKYDRSPPNPSSKYDVLAPITPYIGEIRRIEEV